jgi:hypothetical protein
MVLLFALEEFLRFYSFCCIFCLYTLIGWLVFMELMQDGNESLMNVLDLP